MNKLFIIKSEKEINLLKENGIDNFVYPLFSFCVGVENEFSLSEIKEENSYLFVNRVLDEDSANKLNVVLHNLPSNIKGIIFDDVGIIKMIEDVKIEKILMPSHFACNYESVNIYNEYVDSVVLPFDITEDEVEKIISKSSKKVSLYAFGLIGSAYSRRYLIKNYSKHENVKYENPLVIENNNHKFILKDNVEYNLLEHDFYLDSNMKEAMRVTNKTIMNEIAKFVPNFIGGSADLASATNTYLENLGDFSKEDINGKNIWFGVREHAMGSILNGISLYNYRVFGSTFFSFSDYMKPAMRMAAIMKRPINYIFTHDSISVGQDGPTHQPVEQLAMLRAIPNFNVFRPCDAKEIIGCWNIMINSKTTPSALIISRNEVPLLETSDPKKVMNGAYIVEMERGPLDGIIIATGTEVHNAIHIARDLYNEEKINIRVVSMPSRELFIKTSPEYQEQILPKGYKKFVIEAASSLGWERFVYSDKYLFTVNMFGASGTKDDVYKYCHFDYQTIKKGILDLIR